jgi:hypothetical protein
VFANEPWTKKEVPLKKLQKIRNFLTSVPGRTSHQNEEFYRPRSLFSRSASWQRKEISGERNIYAKKQRLQISEMMRTADRRRVG